MFLKYGEENTISVVVTTDAEPNERWYLRQRASRGQP